MKDYRNNQDYENDFYIEPEFSDKPKRPRLCAMSTLSRRRRTNDLGGETKNDFRRRQILKKNPKPETEISPTYN